MRYAVVEDGVVVNVVMHEGEAPDANHIPSETAGIGYTYDGSVFTGLPAPSVTWDELRIDRNFLLSDTDWTVLADAPISDSLKAQYVTYRQELRDLPSTYPDANNVVWPEEPS